MAEPFHHWSRWGDEVLHRGRCRGTGDLGLMTSFQLLWPPSSQEAGTGTALAWFLWLCTPQVTLYTVRGTLVSAWAMRPASGRKAQLGHLSLEARDPQEHCEVLTSSPEWPLLPQASSSSLALPSRATLLLPRPGGRRELSVTSPGTSVSSRALSVKRGRFPGNWA
uniref:Uncharacterized protein n=1 Tax=Myotis myotis TaxID=51298 RepID=A0A7J7XIX5_MYOMY|nr:hypothetical protein mMyoMyo1_011796 [Myotis myotis]